MGIFIFLILGDTRYYIFVNFHIVSSKKGSIMKTQAIIVNILLIIFLSACQTKTPEPISTSTGIDFTLSAGQTATLTNANLIVTFVSVLGDERCPSEIECAASGPVTVQLSIKDGTGAVTEETLQTFTDYKGAAPSMEFEGIKDRVTINGYQIKILSVLPYPKIWQDEIKQTEYQLGLRVTKE
jgi:hypothetical protein